MNKPITIAVLDCDHLSPDVQPQYHSYGKMFAELFQRLLPAIKLKRFSVIDGQYPTSSQHYDAWLITGSRFDAFADDEWIVQLKHYLLQLNQQKCCLIGICFGHQLLAHMLGGKVGRSPHGWGVGIHSYTPGAHTLLADIPNQSIRLVVSHQDQVLTLPPMAERLWWSDFCPNAAFVYDARILGIQGHPEFTVDYARWLYSNREARLGERFSSAMASLTTPTDGIAVVNIIHKHIINCVKN